MQIRVHERVLDLRTASGAPYDRAYVYAEPQSGGTWYGFIEFVSNDGEQSLRTDRETTQSTAEGVAYWATGLEATYFEGALERAAGRRRRGMAETEPMASRPGAWRVVFRLTTADPEVPFRVMSSRTLVPGVRRYIHNGGAIVFGGAVRESAADDAGVYELTAQFGPEAAAAILANRLWSDLHGMAAAIEIEGQPVPLQHAAIKEGLLGAVVSRH